MSESATGGIISLGLGANLWPAERCREAFENLVKTSFIARPLVSIPVIGLAVSYFFDSYYQKEPLEKALDAAFGPFNDFEGDRFGQRLLFCEPRTLLKSTDECANPLQQIILRDIKVGVTTVNALSNKTTIMSNYNRKRSDGAFLKYSIAPLIPEGSNSS
jgi:phosphate/sulfate permease